jgi:predicted PurR-regulated permease PerM
MSTEQQLDAPLEDQPTEELPPAPPAPLVVPRGVQLVLLLVGLLGLWVAARAARSVVEIIIVASFIALMLNPFVAFLGRRGIPRGVAIPLAYISLLLIIAGIGLALAQPITNQVNAFQRNVPQLVREANKTLSNVRTTSTTTGSTSRSRSRGRRRSTRSRARC